MTIDGELHGPSKTFRHRGSPKDWTASALAHLRNLPGRRLIDLLIAIPALVIVSPLMLFSMLAVWVCDPGPVLFRQIRIGRDGRPFTMLKLRTMFKNCDDAEFRNYNTRELLGGAQPSSSGLYRLEIDKRILPAGHFLRRARIDELPQLINVILGEMSIVGPRPLQSWEVELLSPRHQQRHDVLPGLTGLWQVSGQNRLSMLEMLELDLIYVEHRSLDLDLRIMARTLPALLRSDTC